MTPCRSSGNAAAVLVCVVLLLIVMLGISGFFAWRASVERVRAVAKLDRAENAQRQAKLATEQFEEAVKSLPPATEAAPLRIVSWNVESNGNDPAVIAQQLAELGPYDIFALQKVHPDNIGRYGDAVREGLSRSYRYLASHTGRSDRLMIMYDSERLQLVELRELFSHEGNTLNDWRHRSPLVTQFLEKSSGTEFLFVTVHLARGNADLRQEQARGLREWANDQDLPIVAAGDFNMDYTFSTRRGNRAFDELRTGEVWTWVRPAELVDTNWSDRDGDGQDDYPGSCLDFAFVAGEAVDWDVTSRVVVRAGDFPDDEQTADHRPVEVMIAPAEIRGG